jgi:hypothetical protein
MHSRTDVRIFPLTFESPSRCYHRDVDFCRTGRNITVGSVLTNRQIPSLPGVVQLDSA